MIKKKSELFSPADKQLLSEFVASEFWPLYKKMLDSCLENIKTINLGTASWEETLMNRGRASQIQWEKTQFREINKSIQLEKAKRKAKNGVQTKKEG